VNEPAVRRAIQRQPTEAHAIPPVTAAATHLNTPSAAVEAHAAPSPGTAVRIGCLLPLSGPHRALGDRSLQGIQLALGDDSLVVKDTHGSPETARSAFEELGGRSDVAAVIGPLRSNEAEVVAPLAEPAHMPLLLLAQRDGLTNSFVFQPVMTRDHQASALATYATRAHWRQFGVLAPNDKYGREFTDHFRAAVEARGGRVSWSDSYDPRKHDVALSVEHAREQRNRGNLDAVFIPDTAANAIAVGGALRHAMPDIGLLGPNDWDDPATLATGGTAIDGAVFVAGFYPDSHRPATRAFDEAFRQAHDTTPDIFVAQAYDAAILVREALQHEAVSRQALVDVLHRLGPIAGATGTLRIGDTGVERELFLLRIAGGRLDEVNAGR